MRTVEDIMEDVVAALRPFIIEAFEAGRKSGANDMRAALDAFLHSPVTNDGIVAVIETPDAVLAEGRASPGSVKPAILKVIRQSPGITSDEIQRRTGAKPNSVRGTLWTLQKEELIGRQGDGYIPVPLPVPPPVHAEDAEFRTDD